MRDFFVHWYESLGVSWYFPNWFVNSDFYFLLANHKDDEDHGLFFLNIFERFMHKCVISVLFNVMNVVIRCSLSEINNK